MKHRPRCQHIHFVKTGSSTQNNAIKLPNGRLNASAVVKKKVDLHSELCYHEWKDISY